VAWKAPIERRVLGADGVRGAVLISSTAYGDGGGAIPRALLGSPRDDAGNLIMIGTGRQHWSTVHVADLADAFRRRGPAARPGLRHGEGQGRARLAADPSVAGQRVPARKLPALAAQYSAQDAAPRETVRK
jgi:hypothetical protein